MIEFIKTDKDNFLAVCKSNTIVLEPRKTFDQAIVGYQETSNRLVYSFMLLVGVLVQSDGMTEEEAVEYLYYNTVGPLCEGYPIILEDQIFEE